jgi:hypothetical protein
MNLSVLKLLYLSGSNPKKVGFLDWIWMGNPKTKKNPKNPKSKPQKNPKSKPKKNPKIQKIQNQNPKKIKKSKPKKNPNPTFSFYF